MWLVEPMVKRWPYGTNRNMLDKSNKVQAINGQSNQELMLYSSTGSTNLTQDHICHVAARFQKSNSVKIMMHEI